MLLPYAILLDGLPHTSFSVCGTAGNRISPLLLLVILSFRILCHLLGSQFNGNATPP